MILLEKIEDSLSRNAGSAVWQYVSKDQIKSMCFKDLDEKADELSVFLKKKGVKKNGFVLIYMNKSIEKVIAILAILKVGGAFCCLNPKIRPSQLDYFSQKSGAGLIITDRHGFLSLVKTKEKAGRDLKFIYYSLEEIPEAIEAMMDRSSGISLQVYSKSREIPSQKPFEGNIDGTGPACCLFTSGSTGEPKGVMISRDDLAMRAMTEIVDYGISREDRLLSLLPFSFDVGLNQLFASLLSGSDLIILNSWFPKDIVSVMERLKITGISGVPYIWANLMNTEPDTLIRNSSHSLRYITVSGGSLGEKQLERLRQYFENINIYKTYGQTETFRSTMLRPAEFDKKALSIGRPLKGTDVLIINGEGEIAGPEEDGEIIHRGTGTMLGYIGDEQGTAQKIRHFDFPSDRKLSGRYICTGDLGRFDRDGYLYILCRKDKMIKTMGNRVYPQEVEHALLKHEGVKEAAVFGAKDEIMGEIIVAEVVAKWDLSAQELLVFLAEKLPSYMIPKHIFIVSELPKTETGKISYSEIKGRHEKRGIL